MNIKLILVLLFVVGLGFTTMAQTITIGPRVGVNFGRQIYSEENSDFDEFWNDESESNSGLQIGLVSNFRVSDLFSVQPEFLYVQKGYKFEEGENSAIGKYDYLEVPVLAKFSFGTPQLKGFITAGPTFGYWSSGKDEFKEDGIEFSEDIDFDNENDGIENQFEAGGSIGLGLAYYVGVGALNLDVRYGVGFTSVYDSDDDSKLKNSGVSVSVAYLFGL